MCKHLVCECMPLYVLTTLLCVFVKGTMWMCVCHCVCPSAGFCVCAHRLCTLQCVGEPALCVHILLCVPVRTSPGLRYAFALELSWWVSASWPSSAALLGLHSDSPAGWAALTARDVGRWGGSVGGSRRSAPPPVKVATAAFLGAHTGWNSYIPFITFSPAGGREDKARKLVIKGKEVREFSFSSGL